MKPTFQIISTLILTLAFASVCLADNTDFATEITQANIHYTNKQYQEAVKAYEELINKGYKSGHLYYNLGNAYYRLGRMGPAILNYLRAKPLIPRDKDLEANLKSSYMETIDHLEEKPSKNIFLFWLDDVNEIEAIEALVGASLLFWLTMAFQLFFKTGFCRLARNATLCLLLAAIISLGAKHYGTMNHQTCVVLANTVDVKSSPGADGVTLFQLHEGAVASIAERKDDWYQIELPDDKKGWIKKDSVGV
jgi:tetratricopeptide (TPR) repeat protein